jgi:hypothetical protein
MIKTLLILLTFTSYAQLQTDWDATELLGNMSSSISVGNGCFEGNYKVVTVYGDSEINDEILELMDVTLQVINGNITQYGNIIDYNNHPNILFNCTSAQILVYTQTLSEESTEDDIISLIVYPNPTKTYLNIKSNTFVDYEIYDINGKIVKKGNELVINVTNLKKAMYFLITLHVGGYKQVTKFIKI